MILHEMAHMWFGDLVTMQWWDDLWLNESFAEFCASRPAPRRPGSPTPGRRSPTAASPSATCQDKMPSTHPVAADVADPAEAIANFDGISYAKGASVLKQLVAYVGRDSFFAGIHGYLAEHGWGNATLADLLRRDHGELRQGPGRLVRGLAGDRRAEHAAQPVRGRRRRRVHLVRRAAGGPGRAPDAAAAPHRDRPLQPGRRRAGPHPPGGGRRGRPAHRGAGAGRRGRSPT